MDGDRQRTLNTDPAFLKSLIHAYPDVAWIADPDGVLLACNAGAERLFGIPEAELCGQTDYHFTGRDRETIAAGTPLRRQEWVSFRAGGVRTLMETVRTPLYDSGQRLVAVLSLAREITASHSEHLERIAAALPGAIFSFCQRPDGSTSVPYASPALMDLWGLRPEELAGDAAAAWAAIHPDDFPRIRQALDESPRTLAPWQDEFRVRHPSKGEVWIEGRAIPVPQADGSILHYGFFADITARKKADEALHESREMASRAFHDSPAPMCIVDVEHGRFLEVNGKLIEASGFSRSELIGKTAVELGMLSPEDAAPMADALRAEGCAVDRQLTFHRKNGERLDALYNGHVIAFEGEQRLFSIIHDITGRRRMEEELRAAHSELSAIYTHVPVILMVVDEDLRVRKVNDLALKFAERPEARMLGARHGDAMGCLNALTDPRGCGHGPACGACPIRSAVLDTLQHGARHDNFEAWIPFEGGRTAERCLLVFTAPMHFEGGKRALICALDITDSKRAEGSLQESEARFRTLTEGAPIAMAILRDGLLCYANPAYVSMFGFESVAGMQGLPVIELCAPQCRAAVLERAQQREQGLPVPTQYEAIGLRRDGREFPMLVAAFSMQFTEGPALVVFITDLTVPKHAEEERFRLEQQLQAAQKLESVGRLAGGVAHDFNNLLTVINGYGDLLLRQLQPDDPLRDPIAEIRAAGERAADLTRQLLAFSRKQVLAPKAMNVNHLIEEVRNMLQRLVGEDVELVTHLDPALGQVMADPGQLHQVVMNLAVNARDAMPSGGTVTITTANVELEESYTAGHPELAPGPYVLLAVSDTGPGIPAEIQPRIFDPFFTTKGAGVGTGLGLSTVHGIVRQGGGSISLRTAPGGGAAFDIYLPRLERPAELSAGDGLPPGFERGTETILVVEDQAEVRKLTTMVLRQRGYQVLEAASGAEALLAAERHPGKLHLLLTDVIMPHMNGKELARRLRQLRPEMQVLYMSGYAETVIARHGVIDPGLEFISKPFAPEALAAKVRQVVRPTQ